MKKVWTIYTTILLLFCVIAFQVGKSRAAHQVHPYHVESAFEPGAEAFIPPAREDTAHLEDLRVTGFATISFPEAADIIQSSSHEQRERWAAEIAALPEGPQKRLAAIGFYATWIQFDPQEVCASLAAFNDMLLRDIIVDSVCRAAPAAAMPPLAELVLKFTSMEQSRALPSVINEWAEADPLAACKFITQHPDSLDGNEVGKVIAEWTEVDPNAARSWLEGNEHFFMDDKVVTAFTGKWLEVDSASAIDYVRGHAELKAFADPLRSVTAILYQRGINQALQFLESLPLEARSNTFDDLLGLANLDPEALARITSWTENVFPRESNYQLGTALASWALRDEESALQWIAGHSASERGQLTLALIKGGAALTPRTASLALALPNQATREQAVRVLLQSLSEDIAQARQTIIELHLSQKETSALLHMTEPPPQ